MNACIRSARSVDLDLFLEELSQGTLEFTLDGPPLRLYLPAYKASAIVLQYKLDVSCQAGMNHAKISVKKMPPMKSEASWM
jgi:hypothetical protein